MLESAACLAGVWCGKLGEGDAFVGASLAGVPRLLPLSFPKFAHKREAATCGVCSHAAGVSRGPSHDAWAAWGPVGCVRDVPTLHRMRELLEPGCLDGMASGGWLGLVRSTAHPVREEPRESIVLPCWCFFASKRGKMLLVFIFVS